MLGGYTRVKNGLWTGKHRKIMGPAVFLFGRYLQYMGKYRETYDPVKQEICVIIYPKSVQKDLDIDQETWRSWHQLLESEGYISSHFLSDQNAYAVCIAKAIST